ncbi:hypothetical protein C8J57DRAFT_754645 [Mycena rebaudengoi]|nr:hypothetical protein C8J57DRAFT_754645 [Mycena rebaudengoi]
MAYYRAFYFSKDGQDDHVVPVELIADQPLSAVWKLLLQALPKKTVLDNVLDYTFYKLSDFARDPSVTRRHRFETLLGEVVEHPLPASDFISEIWPNGPDLSLPAKIDLLIIHTSILREASTIAALPPNVRSRHAGFQARNKQFDALANVPSPSSCSKEPDQLFNNHSILAGRPHGRCGPPTALFDSRLAGLTDAIRALPTSPPPSHSLLERAHNIITICLAFYSSEALTTEFNHLFPGGQWQETMDGGVAKPEALWDGMLLELKKERGNGGDAKSQVIADYDKLVASRHGVGEFRDRSPLPHILISVASTQVDLSVAVFTDVIHVDQLFSVNFHDGLTLNDQVLDFARVLAAVRDTFSDLQHYYSALRQGHAIPDLAEGASALHLPSPAAAVSPHTPIASTLGFRFLYKMSRITGEAVDPSSPTDWTENARHMVWVAVGQDIQLAGIPSGQDVVVKFVSQYNVQAHRLLAAINRAPKLYWHGKIRGGLEMAVMEKINGMMAFHWAPAHQASALPRSVYDDVSHAIRTLHDNNIVFGDLRLPNIMVYEEEESVRAALVDFDWAAEHDMGRYPATVSNLDVWHSGVHRYGLMKREHDLYLLKTLLAHTLPITIDP